jgi:hypothetical protein
LQPVTSPFSAIFQRSVTVAFPVSELADSILLAFSNQAIKDKKLFLF